MEMYAGFHTGFFLREGKYIYMTLIKLLLEFLQL